MSSLIVAGGGKFGKKALEFGKKNRYKTILIDNDPNCICASSADYKFDKLNNFYSRINEIKPGEIFFLIYDISIISDLLIKINPEYIIPVIPIHLLAYIISNFLKKKVNFELLSDSDSTLDFVNNANSELILSHNSEKGIVYLSYAKVDEICPDNCLGPENFCPNFKRNKPITITEYFKTHFKLNNNFRIVKNGLLRIIIILESYQLTSGLGGLKCNDLLFVLKRLDNELDKLTALRFSLIIGTTCNCHGVINFYKNII